MKNLFGGAVINYGPTLPTELSTPDGSIFYLTAEDGDNLQGLYLYATVQDFTPDVPGDQTEQHWFPICACGGTEPPEPPRPPDTDNAICPITVNLPRTGTFTLRGDAVSANITGAGAPGTATKAGEPTIIIINGETVTFPGAPIGDTTAPQPRLQSVDISGANRAVQYTVPLGGSLSFCYNQDDGGGDDDGPGPGTHPIKECDGTIIGYGYKPTDTERDPKASVAVMDCDAIIDCYIYPDSTDEHNIKIDDCEGEITGYAFPPDFTPPPPPPPPPPPDTDNAICPSKVQLTGNGTFTVDEDAGSVTVSGHGQPGTAAQAGANVVFMVNNETVTFPGENRGLLTPPTIITKVIEITGNNRGAQYFVPTGAKLEFCYSFPEAPPPNTDDAECPDFVNLTGTGTFTLHSDAKIVNINGRGGAGTSTAAGPTATFKIATGGTSLTTFTFAGGSAGTTTVPTIKSHSINNLSTTNRTIEYSVPAGASIAFCYAKDTTAPPPPPPPPPPDYEGALCPMTINLTGTGTFTFPAAATAVIFTGHGGLNSKPTTYTVNGVKYTFYGTGGTTLPVANTVKKGLSTASGATRECNYTVPADGSLKFCYVIAVEPEDAECPTQIELFGTGSFRFDVPYVDKVSFTGTGQAAREGTSGAGKSTTVTIGATTTPFATFPGAPSGDYNTPPPQTVDYNMTASGSVWPTFSYDVPIAQTARGAFLKFCYTKIAPRPDIVAARCPVVATLTGKGKFILPETATKVNFYAVPKNSSIALTSDIRTPTGLISFSGKVAVTKTFDITANAKYGSYHYDISDNDTVTVCYVDGTAPPPPPGTEYSATYPITDCDGTISGFAYSLTDKKDPAATVAIKDCSGTTLAYIYPTAAVGKNTAIMHCDNSIVGYAVNIKSAAGLINDNVLTVYGLNSVATITNNANWQVGDYFTLTADDPNALNPSGYPTTVTAYAARVSPSGEIIEAVHILPMYWYTSSGQAPNLSTGTMRGQGGSNGIAQWSGGTVSSPIYIAKK